MAVTILILRNLIAFRDETTTTSEYMTKNNSNNINVIKDDYESESFSCKLYFIW